MSLDPIWIVFFAAGITAVTTGLGALPLAFFETVAKRWTGLANAGAAGLMLAASHALVDEGMGLAAGVALAGVVAGLAAVFVAQRVLHRDEEFSVAELSGADARRALLIVGIMTAHSFAEGVGVGVSFAGREGLGTFITTAIALHNVPEGLAIALVLVPRGTPVAKAAGWAVFSSLPQPLMAVPAYAFVEWFRPVLPFGLGFAAGAMLWMVFAELLRDALRDADAAAVGAWAVSAFAAMMAVQRFLL